MIDSLAAKNNNRKYIVEAKLPSKTQKQGLERLHAMQINGWKDFKGIV